MSEALISRLERLEGDVAEIKAILSHLVPMITRIDQRLTSAPPPARRADVAAGNDLDIAPPAGDRAALFEQQRRAVVDRLRGHDGRGGSPGRDGVDPPWDSF